MSGRPPAGSDWPWTVRIAGVLVVVGLVLAGLQSVGSRGTTTVRGAGLGSRGTQVDEAPGQGKGESAATGNPAKPSATTKPPATGKGTKPPKGRVKPPPRRRYWHNYGPNHTGRVALTFDDCPKSLAELKQVLRGASRLGIGLMLFPTGLCVRSGHFDARYARSQGHYVFNHSVSHPQLTRLSYSDVLRQLGPPGIQARYGRPPFGDWNATVARAYTAKGMRIWMWTVDTGLARTLAGRGGEHRRPILARRRHRADAYAVERLLGGRAAPDEGGPRRARPAGVPQLGPHHAGAVLDGVLLSDAPSPPELTRPRSYRRGQTALASPHYTPMNACQLGIEQL